MNMNKYKLSVKELEVMQLLWKHNTALSITDITTKSDLKKNTVQTSVKSLLNKNYIKIEKIDYNHTGTVLARNFSPTFTAAEYIKCNFSTSYNSKMKIDILACLVEDEDNDDIIDGLISVLEKRKKALER